MSGPAVAQQPEPSGELATLLKREAARLGFGLVGIVAAKAMDQYAGIEAPHWQVRGSTGHPADVMPDARSVVALGFHAWDPRSRGHKGAPTALSWPPPRCCARCIVWAVTRREDPSSLVHSQVD